MILGVAFIKLVQHGAMVFYYIQNSQLSPKGNGNRKSR